MFQASALALLPELGQLNRQQIAKLVGVAPLNHADSTGGCNTLAA
jgi:transposase